MVKVEQISAKFEQNSVVPSVCLSELHDAQVRLIKFNPALDLVVTADQAGCIEIWDPESHDLPTDGRISFEMLSETDYYTLATSETFALAMEFSKDWKLLAVYGRDCRIRVFHFSTGRLICTIEETVEKLQREQ